MSVLKSQISYFNNIRQTDVIRKPYSIEDCINSIREGDFKDLIVKIRKGKNDELKKDLPAIATHGVFRDYRKAKDFIIASGLIIIDIDDIEGEDSLDDIKQDIMDSFSYVFSAMISPSGNGIKVLCYVEPDSVTADNYREIGKYLSNDFQQYGTIDYLSITDCLLMTWDPNILVNEDAITATVYLKEKVLHKVELEKLDKNKILWTDAEEFFETVLLDSIQEKSSNNFHFLQMGMLDLAKYGFYHPKQDLSFIIDYAEAAHKRSSDNKNRFLELVEICKSYPQAVWPYKTVRSEEDEMEEEVDYSEYTTKKSKEESREDEERDEEEDGLIDYDNFWDRFLEVAMEGDRVGAEISLKNFADIFRFRGSGILTVTGIPGHGKTEFIDQCILDLARLYGHETLIAGYEQSAEEHVLKLTQKLIGKNITCKSYLTKENIPTIKKAQQYIVSKIKHINTIKFGGEITSLLKKAAIQVQKSRENGDAGVRYLVIDPYNMLSLKGSKLNGFEKVEEILRRITHFSHQMDVMVILVAHPVKIKKDQKTGAYEVPDFYSVKGSSAFFEMSYHGLVVFRHGYKAGDTVLVRVLKVKQSKLGKTMADANFTYEENSGRYVPIDDEGNEDSGDHRAKDWLEKAINLNNEKPKSKSAKALS